MPDEPTGRFSPAAVVGAGRVGLALAIFLERLGLDVTVGVRSDHGRERVEAASDLPTAAPADAVRGARLVVLAVFDEDLAGTLGRIPGTVWGVTGDPVGREVVTMLGGRPMDVPSSGRVRYHVALVLAANGAAALSASAADILRAGGVIDPGAVLGGLVHASVDAALATGQAGMSGPWVRGEGRTIGMHVEALARKQRLVKVYAALARLIGDRAAAAGRLDPDARRRVEAALQGQDDDGEDSGERRELLRRLGRRARGRDQR